MKNSTEVKNDVLFQKIGNTWYIFSEINGEMYYSSLPQGMDPRSTSLKLHAIIEEHMEKVAKVDKRGIDRGLAL